MKVPTIRTSLPALVLLTVASLLAPGCVSHDPEADGIARDYEASSRRARSNFAAAQAGNAEAAVPPTTIMLFPDNWPQTTRTRRMDAAEPNGN